MFIYKKFDFCKLPDTPRYFDKEKLKTGDPDQKELYKKAKKPDMDTILTYEQIIDEIKRYNYARFVPKGYIFIDFDDPEEAEKMREIILRSKLRCLILETTKGYHFLFKIPTFYKVQITGATNWFGYKFDTKGVIDKEKAVQIIRVCGMERKEYCSWNFTETVTPDKLEKLDILPYWLFGKKEDKDLHKEGKTGESKYTLTNTPFTQLMVMKEGYRHDHIFNKCRYFACSNGFEYEDFKSLITSIHDQYLVKIGTAMPDSDLFGDTETKWEEDIEKLESNGWVYNKKDRKWKKAKSKKEDKIDERRASEYLFNEFDFYVKNPNATGIYTELLYREIDGDYEYKKDLSKIRKKLREYSDQNFKDSFFKEMEGQLMQLCAENEKLIKRNHQYVLTKNKVLFCKKPNEKDFSWLGTRPPTDVVLPWNWYPEEWVEEHKDDLGGNISKFIKQLARDSSGRTQPEVEQWLYVIAGAAMIPKNDFETIVILSGGGQNGKSVYNSLIRLCLGEEMFNTSRIFDCDPQDSFWGKDFDKGICCIVDDLPPNYSKATFSYLKGALTKSDSFEINEKHKPKRLSSEIPQIIICNNNDLKLNDKSEGMKRRILILPTEFHIDNKDKDLDLQYKLVLNTTNSATIDEYKISEDAFNEDGVQVMNLYTKQKCVLDSLKDGSLAWFANKARYEYFKAKEKKFVIGKSDKMKKLCGDTFKNKFQIELEEFIKWYVDNKCGTDSSRDLSKANIHFNKLYPVYELYCEEESKEKMKEGQFRIFCRPAIINLGYQIIDKKMKKKNGKKEAYRYVVFSKEV